MGQVDNVELESYSWNHVKALELGNCKCCKFQAHTVIIKSATYKHPLTFTFMDMFTLTDGILLD